MLYEGCLRKVDVAKAGTVLLDVGCVESRRGHQCGGSAAAVPSTDEGSSRSLLCVSSGGYHLDSSVRL